MEKNKEKEGEKSLAVPLFGGMCACEEKNDNVCVCMCARLFYSARYQKPQDVRLQQDHLVPHDIIVVPPETLYTHIHMHTLTHLHTLPYTLLFPYPHQVPNKVHLPCVEHMLVTVICLSEEEENFNKLCE